MEIYTTNTVLARCYGLRKIHKEDYSLRLVISTINIPNRFLEHNRWIKVKSHTKLDEKEFLK